MCPSVQLPILTHNRLLFCIIKFNISADARVKFMTFVNRAGDTVEYPEVCFPFDIFIINETINVSFLTSQSLNPSEFVVFSSTAGAVGLSSSLCKLSIHGGYSLLEHCGWASPHIVATCVDDTFFSFISVYSSLITNLRLLVLSGSSTHTGLNSISGIYSNGTWMERESSEMLDIVYLGLRDTRRLLLDYSTSRGVLRKGWHSTKAATVAAPFTTCAYTFCNSTTTSDLF